MGNCYSLDRVMHCLRTAVKESGVSRRVLEDSLGKRRSYLDQVFTGRIRLTLETLLIILDEIDVHPAFFIDLCFPRRKPAKTASERRFERLFVKDLPEAKTKEPEAAEEGLPSVPEVAHLIELVVEKTLERRDLEAREERARLERSRRSATGSRASRGKRVS